MTVKFFRHPGGMPVLRHGDEELRLGKRQRVLRVASEILRSLADGEPCVVFDSGPVPLTAHEAIALAADLANSVKHRFTEGE